MWYCSLLGLDLCDFVFVGFRDDVAICCLGAFIVWFAYGVVSLRYAVWLLVVLIVCVGVIGLVVAVC